ncbi:hypothetical protein REPUB_Repub11eG0134300 [Reevesia pubescens]
MRSKVALVRILDSMNEFLDVMHNCNWIDMGASGCKYTLTNNQPLPALIKKRLDRALCNVKWRQTFEEALMLNLPRLYGDHCPLLLRFHDQARISTRLRPFRFEMSWLTHADFDNFMQQTWMTDADFTTNITQFTTKNVYRIDNDIGVSLELCTASTARFTQHQIDALKHVPHDDEIYVALCSMKPF